MHLLIPYAADRDPGCRQALRDLPLTQLASLLGQLQPGPIQRLPTDCLELAHERALASSLGLPAPAPWAALAARALGLNSRWPWAFITPCYWEVGQAQVSLHDPQQLKLTDDESLALLAAMQPYFAEDGLTLHFERADRWLVSGAPLEGLHTASLERVIGRNLAPWLPASPLLKRLQNEMQMLLYTHPVNDQRLSRGQSAVNSFWVSDIGRHEGLPPSTPPVMPMDLRLPALRQDWTAWRSAWQAIDRGPLKTLLLHLQQGHPVQLTLCSENASQCWASQTATSALRRLLARLRWVAPANQLQTLCD